MNILFLVAWLLSWAVAFALYLLFLSYVGRSLSVILWSDISETLDDCAYLFARIGFLFNRVRVITWERATAAQLAHINEARKR